MNIEVKTFSKVIGIKLNPMTLESIDIKNKLGITDLIKSLVIKNLPKPKYKRIIYVDIFNDVIKIHNLSPLKSLISKDQIFIETTN